MSGAIMHSFGGSRLNSGGYSFTGWIRVKKRRGLRVERAALQAIILPVFQLKGSFPATKYCER